MTLLDRLNLLNRGLRWYRRVSQSVASQAILQQQLAAVQVQLCAAESRVVLLEERARGERAARLWGVPMDTVQPNEAFSRPYRPDREGLRVRYLGNRLSPAQQDSVWYDTRGAQPSPPLLGGRIELQVGDCMTILDHRPYDLSVGTPMIKVRHEPSGREGFVTLETLVAETTECDGELWVAEDKPRLRGIVEFDTADGILYSTNRVSPVEVAASIEYLEQFLPGRVPAEKLAATIHPLQAGAHAHRIGVWALWSERAPDERQRVAMLIDAMFGAYGLRVARTLGDALAWPYAFDFVMPWGTKLASPWYSGYANSAMVAACACAWRLTGTNSYREAAQRGSAFLRRPMTDGGAFYVADGFKYVAEYCYPAPPIPNYRVLDGELCSLVFLYNAALMLRDSDLLAFATGARAGAVARARPLLRRRWVARLRHGRPADESRLYVAAVDELAAAGERLQGSAVFRPRVPLAARHPAAVRR